MAVYTIPVLLTRISTYIKTNGTKDITGAVMQSILTDVVDSLNAIIGPNLTLNDVLSNGNDAQGQDINLNGVGAKLSGLTGLFGTINALLYATGIVILKSENNVVNMRTSADLDLTFSLAALTASRQLTFQDKAITVAGLDDIANAVAAYLKLDGTTPMTGDLDMLTNGVAVRTDDIKTSLGLLELIYGNDKLVLDFSAILGGVGSYLQTFRAKAGTVAHLDDIKSINFIEHTETSHTGNITETVLHTIEIPANTIVVGDLLDSYIQATAIGLAGLKTFKIYIGPNPNLTGAELIYNYFTNNLRYQFGARMWVGAGSVIKQFRQPSENNSNRLFGSDNSGIVDTAVIDFTTTKYLVVSVQLTDASDSVNLRVSNLQVSKTM